MENYQVSMDVEYAGELNTRAIHGPSGQILFTDAPVDNQGKGAYFSPTDLMAASVGSCITTTFAIVARRDGLDLTGLKVRVRKEMTQTAPRRIAKLYLDFTIPTGFSEEDLIKLKNTVRACPAVRSLHPDVELISNYRSE
ncbi:MAG: OsmC family protein [Chloroflexota bacterium]